MNKYLIIWGGFGLVLSIILGSYIYTLRHDVKSLREQLSTKQAIIASYQENTVITEQVGFNYEKDIMSLNDTLRGLLSSTPSCVPVTCEAKLSTEPRPRGEHDRKNGLSDRWLYNYAAEAELLRIERNACRDFVNKVWTQKKGD